MESIATCISDLNTIKQSALFFDNVVPFPLEALPKMTPDFYTSEQVVKEIWEFIPEEIYNKLVGIVYYGIMMPNEFRDGHKFRALFLLYLMLMYSMAINYKNERKFGKTNLKCEIINFKDFGLTPIFILPEERIISKNLKSDDLSVTLCNMNLINTESASWDQIIEVRKDEQARLKIRNLRLFLQTNYTGKSKQFIEDDLGKRLYDYQNVVKDYGFNTITSALTMITNSKNLVTFGTAGLAAILFGEPVLASASIITGLSMEIANVSLELIKQQRDFQKLKRDFNLAYLIELKSKFNKGEDISK